MGRGIILLFFLPLVLSYIVNYQSELFLERGKEIPFKVTITSNDPSDSGYYEISLEKPPCIQVDESKVDLGYIGQGEEREVYFLLKSTCEDIEKVKLTVDGPKDKNFEILVVTYRDPRVKIDKEKILYGVENEIEISIEDFDGEKVCISGDFVGEKKICSKDGIFRVKVFGDATGKKTLKLNLEIYKNSFVYNISKEVTVVVEDPEPKVVVDPYLKKEGVLKLGICENCMICLYSDDLILNQTCSRGYFEYKYVGEEGEVKVGYVLLKKEFGRWVPVRNGSLKFLIEGEGKLNLLFAEEGGRLKVYIANPSDKEVRDVFVKAGRYEKYFPSIPPHDYESFEIERGCYNVTVTFDGGKIERYFCQKRGFLGYYLIPILLLPFFLLIRKVI